MTGPSYIVLSKLRESGWMLMPELLRRVFAFCLRYGSGAQTGVTLCRSLGERFGHENPTLFGVIFFDEGRPIGHGLLSIDEWVGEKWTTVMQFHLERTIPRAVIRAALADAEAWGRGHGCVGFQSLASSAKHARAYSICYGFDYYCTVSRRRFAVEGEQPGQPATPEDPELGASDVQGTGNPDHSRIPS